MNQVARYSMQENQGCRGLCGKIHCPNSTTISVGFPGKNAETGLKPKRLVDKLKGVGSVQDNIKG